MRPSCSKGVPVSVSPLPCPFGRQLVNRAASKKDTTLTGGFSRPLLAT